MKSWSDFYTVYMTDLNGLTAFQAANQLRLAAQEFCQTSKALVQTQDEVLTVAEETVYDFELASNVILVQVIDVTLDGQIIYALNSDRPSNAITSFQAIDTRQFELTPAPAAGLKIITRAAVKPGPLSTGVEDWLFEQYGETIAHGARARLMSMQNKPYSDMNMAVKEQQQFAHETGKATRAAAKRWSKAPLRVRPNFF